MADIKTENRFRAKGWKAKLGLVLLSIVFTCILLEAALRVKAGIEQGSARPVQASSTPEGEYWAIYDPDLGYRQNPKWGDLNSDGLRDHPIGPKNGRSRLLFLGDSIAFYGDDADDTFVAYLRKAMHGIPGYERLDIVNAGIKGFTNYQEVQYLKKYGLSFEPDMVGVQFCLNDLHKFLHSFRIENDQIVYGSYQFSSEALGSQPQKPKTLLQRVVDKSYLLSEVQQNVPIAARAIAWKASRGFSFDYSVDMWTAWQDDPWNDIERQFQEMISLGDQRNFKVFVVVVPLKVQYNSDYLVRNRDYVLKPQRKLREICERLGLPFLDLYPEMDGSLYMSDGIHLTQEGRKSVGNRIARFMVDSGLNPARPPRVK